MNTVRPDELSATLRRLRRDARLSGIEAARAASLSQPKISRLETGKQVPTKAEVEALCRVYGASACTKQQSHVGSPAVMIAQLQHLAEVTRRSNVRLGVIPWTRPVRVGALHGFHLYDRRAAIVGTETATAIITDAHDIADYETCFAT